MAESVAAMTVMIPILTSCAMVIAEVTHAYVIKQGLQQCAREAARSMGSMYNETTMLVGDRTLQDILVYSKVRASNIVNASTQFDTAVFDMASEPPTVTVNVRYTSGQNGLALFPLFDPLKLGSNFKISANATYPLY
ncbi:MAG: hypothetical protein K2X27_15370 [Candidatus Obscuribacterales bacterium]|nr:hypothetical protein [Candidatus Obscuribacterales bacterium]